ncbi:MAG: hypothetical protein DI539_24165 [Flavobacterium psychrophilum]|nr:MAG: hypothetical protein DI539_24165 [Flavobacterium psychrophilum]
MKKKLFLCLSFSVLFFSCSDNDQQNGSGTELVKIKTTSYYMGETESSGETLFENGKSISYNVYKGDGTLKETGTYTYDNDLLTSLKGFNVQGQQIYSSDYLYDDLGRLTQKTFSDIDYSGVTNYTFNTDATITATTQSSGSSYSRTFSLNADNLIYKEERAVNNYVYEVTYEGSNIVKTKDGNSTRTYEYLSSPLPQNGFANPWGINDNYKANVVLRGGQLDAAENYYATKYVSKINSVGMHITYEHTFNDQGLLIKTLSYYNGELEGKTEYFYN